MPAAMSAIEHPAFDGASGVLLLLAICDVVERVLERPSLLDAHGEDVVVVVRQGVEAHAAETLPEVVTHASPPVSSALSCAPSVSRPMSSYSRMSCGTTTTSLARTWADIAMAKGTASPAAQRSTHANPLG